MTNRTGERVTELTSVCLLLLLLAVMPRLTAAQALDPALVQKIETLEPKLIEWRRDFHQHPELSNREVRTAEKVAAHLKRLGLEVTTGVAHTGVVGLLVGSRPGPVVALRADMDALPVTERVDLPFASREKAVFNGEEVGVMHACGHDTHVAILMAVAEVLAGMQADLPGTVKFIFQPAEEGAPIGEEGGAELMVNEGILSNPTVDAAFALHIDASQEAGTVSYNAGGTFASSDDFRITVTGKSAHGASPWSGVDPVLTAAQIITALQTVVSRQVPITEGAAVVTVGSIHGGNRSNIIPEKVEMVGTIRSLNPAVRTAIHEKVRRIALNTAAAMGATVEIELPYTTSYPVTFNDPDLTARMGRVLAAVAGPDKVLAHTPETGAEDFAFIAEQVPSFYFLLGGRTPGVPVTEVADHHTPDFYIDERGLLLGVKAMTAVALAYLRAGARP